MYDLTMLRIDITLISGSRPELLELTLSSFAYHVFPFFTIGNVFANVDLFGGGRERNTCKKMIWKLFPEAIIFSPQKSSFGMAIKNLWKLPESKHFLHLEDDWVCHRNISPEDVFSRLTNVEQLILAQKGPWQTFFTSRSYVPLPFRILGPIGIPNLTKPQFSTSPSFIESGFSKAVSELLMPDLHPEKQLYGPWNRPLVELTKRSRAKFLCRWYQSPYITDIGRAWHLAKKVRPRLLDGKISYY